MHLLKTFIVQIRPLMGDGTPARRLLDAGEIEALTHTGAIVQAAQRCARIQHNICEVVATLKA